VFSKFFLLALRKKFVVASVSCRVSNRRKHSITRRVAVIRSFIVGTANPSRSVEFFHSIPPLNQFTLLSSSSHLLAFNQKGLACYQLLGRGLYKSSIATSSIDLSSLHRQLQLSCPRCNSNCASSPNFEMLCALSCSSFEGLILKGSRRLSC
jgi:hypothetical protein